MLARVSAGPVAAAIAAAALLAALVAAPAVAATSYIRASYVAPAGTTTYSGSGLFLGTVPLASGVPEATTWSMMLIGFGAVGSAIRRRRGVAPSFSL